MSHNLNRKGFTLIELLIVIAVVGVLSAGVITSINIVSKINSANIAKSETFDASIQNSLSIDLVGEWTFSGNTNDTSGYGNDGTPNGGAAPAPDRKGQDSKAYSFDGINDFMGYDTSTKLDLTNVGTVAAWVYITAYPGAGKYPGIVSKGSQYGWGTPGYAIWINGDAGGNVKALIVNLGIPLPTRNEISWGHLATGTWWHLVFTWNGIGSNLNIYKNGVSAATPVTQTLNANPVGLAFEMGRATAGTHYANVTMDDVRIYNQALTSYSVQQLYAQGLEKHQLAKN